METLHIWRTFVSAGVVDGATFPHSTHWPHLDMPLVEYLAGLQSSRVAWLVNLELVALPCSAMELKTLACLDNLETLFIRYETQIAASDDGFNDSVIEKLASHASREGKLPHLKMLFVQNCGGVTKAAFSVLSQFPSLDVFCVSGTSVRAKHKEAKLHGWRRGQRCATTSLRA